MKQFAITRLFFASAFACSLLTANAQADVAKANIKGALTMTNTVSVSSSNASTISARQFQLAYPKVWAHLQSLNAPADSRYEIVDGGILVSYTQKSTSSQVAYNNDQRLNYAVVDMPASALPLDISRQLKQYYGGYTITNARHITDAQGQNSYRLVAESQKEIAEIIIKDGELYTANSYSRR